MGIYMSKILDHKSLRWIFLAFFKGGSVDPKKNQFQFEKSPLWRGRWRWFCMFLPGAVNFMDPVWSTSYLQNPEKLLAFQLMGFASFYSLLFPKNLCLSTGPPYINTKPPPWLPTPSSETRSWSTLISALVCSPWYLPWKKNMATLAGNEHYPSPGEKETHLQKYRGVAGSDGSLRGSFLLSVFLAYLSLLEGSW